MKYCHLKTYHPFIGEGVEFPLPSEALSSSDYSLEGEI